jgi:HEAT repeat protein
LILEGADRAETKANRSRARQDLIDMGGAAVPYLIERIQDPNFTIRWEMVNILGYIKDRRGTDPLIARVLHDADPHTRWRSMWALTSVGDPTTAGKFRGHLEDDDPFAAWNAAVGLAMVAADPAAVPHLKKGLGSEDAWVRWEAVDGLGHVHDATTSRDILPLLADTDARVRHEVVMALGAIGDETARRELIRILDSPDAQLRWRAAMHLGRIGGEEGRRALEARLAVEESAQVRDHLAKALGR